LAVAFARRLLTAEEAAEAAEVVGVEKRRSSAFVS
jgi:hypothetical protein